MKASKECCDSKEVMDLFLSKSGYEAWEDNNLKRNTGLLITTINYKSNRRQWVLLKIYLDFFQQKYIFISYLCCCQIMLSQYVSKKSNYTSNYWYHGRDDNIHSLDKSSFSQ